MHESSHFPLAAALHGYEVAQLREDGGLTSGERGERKETEGKRRSHPSEFKKERQERERE